MDDQILAIRKVFLAWEEEQFGTPTSWLAFYAGSCSLPAAVALLRTSGYLVVAPDDDVMAPMVALLRAHGWRVEDPL